MREAGPDEGLQVHTDLHATDFELRRAGT